MLWVFDEIKDRLNPKTRGDEKLVRQLCRRLNKLGYHFSHKLQFDVGTFKTEDAKVIPIIIEYIDKFKNDGYKLQFICSLGTKGFCDATEFLLNKYKENLPPKYNWWNLNIISQVLAKICDVDHLDDYYDIFDRNVTVDAAYLVEMLGKLKIREAVPHLIKLLDCEAIIPDNWVGNLNEDNKYLVSQMAIKVLGNIGIADNVKYIEKFLEPEKLDFIHYSINDPKELNRWLNGTYQKYRKITTKAIEQMKSRNA